MYACVLKPALVERPEVRAVLERLSAWSGQVCGIVVLPGLLVRML